MGRSKRRISFQKSLILRDDKWRCVLGMLFHIFIFHIIAYVYKRFAAEFPSFFHLFFPFFFNILHVVKYFGEIF